MPAAPLSPNSVSLLRRPGCWIVACTGLPLLIAAAYLVENSLGTRQLARAKADMAAAGMPLTVAAVKQPTPADADNFCAIPLLAAIGKGVDPVPGIEPVTEISNWVNALTDAGVEIQDPQAPAPTDWQHVFDCLVEAGHIDSESLESFAEVPDAAKEALALKIESVLAPVTAELMGALDRPHAVFRPGYLDAPPSTLFDGSPSRSYASLLFIAKAYKLRATLAIDRGDGATVVDSCRLLLRIATANEAESPLIAALVSAAITQLAVRIVWTACAARTLQESDYTRLAQLLHTIRPLDTLRDILHAEATLSQVVHDWMRQSPALYLAVMRDPSDPARTLPPVWKAGSLFIPPGWFDANQATSLRLNLRLLSRLEDPSIIDRYVLDPWLKDEMERANQFPFHGFTVSSWSILERPIEQRARIHAVCRLAESACALEAHFAGFKEYPATLAAVVPSVLPAPPDDLDRQPIRYAPSAATGRYRLWSVGNNGVDEGGTETVPLPPAKPIPWQLVDGDLVWEYPP